MTKQGIVTELNLQSNAAIQALQAGVESADGLKTDKFMLCFFKKTFSMVNAPGSLPHSSLYKHYMRNVLIVLTGKLCVIERFTCYAVLLSSCFVPPEPGEKSSFLAQYELFSR